MLNKWKERRHKWAIGATAAGAALAVVSMAAPAGAVSAPSNVNYPATPANNTLVGSGSSTDYQMMISLDALFDQVPGCVITSGSVSGAPSKASQQLNYSCETSTGVTGTPTAGTTLEQQPGYAYLDNPINDNAVEEAPMGSSNGIAQLELGRNQANTGIGTNFTSSTPQQVSEINYARSSRDPSGANDITGLNFVAYAKDGVAPLIFTEYNSSKTLFGKNMASTGLSTADIQDIWNGTIYDWGQLPGNKSSDPIFVYSAQEGSGTQATFKTFLTFDPSSASNKVNCKDPVAPGTKVVTAAGKSAATFPGWTFPSSNTSGGSWATGTGPTASPLSDCLGPDVIFENETASIVANATTSTEDSIASAWAGNNNGASPVGDSIFFYSFGKFNLQCEGIKEQISYLDKSSIKPYDYKAGDECGTVPAKTDNDKMALLPVNGVGASAATILATSGTVYPIDRFLYNVYSNGSNSNLPAATAATLNYVSEVGFLCKPQTVDASAETAAPGLFSTDTNAKDIIDPATGLWYHDEIFDTIVANGFIPVTATGGSTFATLADGPPISENAGTSPASHTGYDLLSGADLSSGGSTYLDTSSGVTVSGDTYPNTTISEASDPIGYCILSDTDGNANS